MLKRISSLDVAPFDARTSPRGRRTAAVPTTPSFFVVGHRGSPIADVENTLGSVRRAIHEGANALEVDLCITRDEEVVLWHDFDPNESCARFRQWGFEPYVGFRPIVPFVGTLRKVTSELTLAELRRHYGYAEKSWFGQKVDRNIPVLGELFEWAERESRLRLVFLDVKLPKAHIARLPAILRRLDSLSARYLPRFQVVLESAVPEVVREIRRLAPSREVVLDVEPHAGFVFDLHSPSAVRAAIRHKLRRAVAQRPRSITLFPFETHRRIIEADMELLRRHNAEHPEAPIEGVCSFLINEPEEMDHLLSLGVTAIQTDKPLLLRTLAESHGHRFTARGSTRGSASTSQRR